MSRYLEQFVEQTKFFGLETSAKRFYSVYRGIVTSTLDEDRMGRIKVRVPLISEQLELPHYAFPIAPFAGLGYGIFFQPAVGEQVYVLFEHGDINKPLYVGGWWANPATSDLPGEIFNPANPTSTKLIKTPIGHGIVFEEASAAKRVEIFSGEQSGPGTTLKLHRIVLDDTNERILLESKGKHFLSLSDIVGAQFVRLGSTSGFLLTLDDTLQRASVVTPGGHTLRLDDQQQEIVILTKLGHSMRLSDLLNIASMQTVGGRAVRLDDTSQTLTIQDSALNSVIFSPVGVSVVAAGALSMVASAAATLVSAGPMTLTGGGVSLTSLGGAPSSQLNTGNASSLTLGTVANTIVGAVLMILLGGASVNVVGGLAVFGLSIVLGGAAARRLVDERILAWLAAHTHPFTAVGLGVPGVTGVPVTAAALTVPGAYTTTKVTAE